MVIVFYKPTLSRQEKVNFILLFSEGKIQALAKKNSVFLVRHIK